MKKIQLLLILVGCAVSSFAAIKCDHNHKNEIKLDHLWGKEKLPYIQKSLRDQASWQNFQSTHGSWYVDFDEISALPHRASGPAIDMSFSGSPEEAALYFIDNYLTDFEFSSENLEFRSVNSGEKYHYVDFTQKYDGISVKHARVTLRLTMDLKVLMFGIDYMPNIDLDVNPAISETDILAHASNGLSTNFITEEQTMGEELYILPIPQGDHYIYKLVYAVETRVEIPNKIPEWYHTLVDAQDGTIYERINKVCAIHPEASVLTNDVQVNGEVFNNPNSFMSNPGMPYIEINVNGTSYNADEDGFLNYTGNNGDIANIPLRGPYSTVYRGATGTTQSVLTGVTLNQGSNSINVNANFGTVNAETSAYKHVNTIHDHFKTLTGSTIMDFQLTTRVERTDGDCNAFYNGTSINFYAQGTSDCWSLALFEDVVYHEYGHGINSDYYQELGAGGMDNGGLNEGYADVWAFTINENPVLAEGYLVASPTAVIRRYDVDPKVYPDDLTGEVHDNGEIIAGAWWDTYLELGDFEYMKFLFKEAYLATSDGPAGQEGGIYTDVLIEALLADDDDADISNGTPNGNAILTAFAIHGITLLGNVDLDHEQVEVAAANTPITVETTIDVDFSFYLGDVVCHWRTDNTQAFQTLAMNTSNQEDYSIDIPAQPNGTVIEYYFSIADNNGIEALVKPHQADASPIANLPYFTLVGYDEMITENFDIFTGQSWTFNPMGADDAATGTFEIESPNASFQTDLGFIVQTGTDHTPNNATNNCLVTENGNSADAYNLHDVDDGATSVASPLFDVAGMIDPIISYWRWFSNTAGANPGNDYIKAFLTNDGVNWVKVERNNIEDVSWRQNVVRIADYVTPNEMVQIMFIAEDSVIYYQDLVFNGGSIVEAAFDDVVVYDRISDIEAPTASFTWIQSTDEVNFTDNSTGDPTSWFWEFGDGNTSPDQSPVYTYASTGTYTVCLTVTNAGGSNTTCNEVTVAEVGIEEFLAGFSIFPNPANDVLSFTLNEDLKNATVEIYDNTGRTVYIQADTQEKSISLESFSEGLYWISITTDDLRLKSSFVISR